MSLHYMDNYHKLKRAYKVCHQCYWHIYINEICYYIMSLYYMANYHKLKRAYKVCHGTFILMSFVIIMIITWKIITN
jgi:hypothetical protein